MVNFRNIITTIAITIITIIAIINSNGNNNNNIIIIIITVIMIILILIIIRRRTIIIMTIIITKYGWNTNNNISIQHINLYELLGATVSIIKYTSKLILNCLQELINNLLNLQTTYPIATNKIYEDFIILIKIITILIYRKILV